MVDHQGSDVTRQASGVTKRELPPRILLYSDDSSTRERVRLAVGARLERGGPKIEWVETATHAAVIAAADAGGLDLMILDGEAAPSGGMGLCRQLKNEIYECPPALLLTGRPQDAWLASWSLADGIVAHPLDPVEVQRTVSEVLARSVQA